jgi:hypothetical protein
MNFCLPLGENDAIQKNSNVDLKNMFAVVAELVDAPA